jgi:hypothetical protein
MQTDQLLAAVTVLSIAARAIGALERRVSRRR